MSMTILDWNELQHNGTPAVISALEQLQKAVNSQASQLNLLDYQLRRALAEQAREVEKIRGLLRAPQPGPSTPSEVVADLGHGWRIERRPASIPDETITMEGKPADSWLPNDWVVQFAAVADEK